MPRQAMKQRKDTKGRVLMKGESQRSIDGMYIYTYTTPFGKRGYAYSTDLFKLREKEKEIVRAQLDGLNYYAGEHVTLNMAFDRYMAIKRNIRETTRTNYKYMYDRFVRNEIGDKTLDQIKNTDIKLFYNYLLDKKGIGVSTLDTIHTVIHPIFDMAVLDDMIRRNPSDMAMKDIKANTPKNKGIRHALTLEQQKAFMDYIKFSPEFYHWYPIFYTLLSTGMRIGECVGITWKDIDLKKRIISVNHAATYYMRNGRACFRITKTKTAAGVRQIPIMDGLASVLEEEYARQKREGFCQYELDGYGGFVFWNKLGQIHNPHCINMAINRITELHNSTEISRARKESREPLIIPHFSCHTLRHTFCSRLCENEVNIKVIQEIMGHSDIRTTLDIYTEVNFNKKKDSLDLISKNLDIF